MSPAQGSETSAGATRTGSAGVSRPLSIRRGWSDAQWDRFLAAHPEATFFHTRIWARLVLASFPGLRDESVWFETGSGSCLVPAFAWRRAGGLLTTLHSSFPFLYGGPVPARTEADESLLPAVLEALRRPLASARVTGNPLAPAGPGEAPPEGVPGFDRQVESTHLMPLPATEEEFWEGTLTTAKRNDVRRLGKKGVVVEDSAEEEDARAVYGFYLDSFSRWGGRPGMVYPWEFYRNLLRLGGDALRLTIARHEGKLIGGTFFVRWNGTVHYLAGYFDHASRALRPNVLIQVESILRAIRDRFRVYDFLPSGGHVSVETFKESFGGRKTPFAVYTRAGLPHRMLGRGGPAARLKPAEADG